MGGERRHERLLAFVTSFSYFNCPRKTFISMGKSNGVGVDCCGKTSGNEGRHSVGGSVPVAP